MRVMPLLAFAVLSIVSTTTIASAAAGETCKRTAQGWTCTSGVSQEIANAQPAPQSQQGQGMQTLQAFNASAQAPVQYAPAPVPMQRVAPQPQQVASNNPFESKPTVPTDRVCDFDGFAETCKTVYYHCVKNTTFETERCGWLDKAEVAASGSVGRALGVSVLIGLGVESNRMMSSYGYSGNYRSGYYGGGSYGRSSYGSGGGWCPRSGCSYRRW